MSETTQIARFALVSRVAMLVATSFTVILTTRTLGASGQGDWALLQFGLLLVTGLAGFVSGGAVVYVRRFFSATAMVPLAVAGIMVATALGGWFGAITRWVPEHWTSTSMVLGAMQAAIIFLSQLHLAAGNLRHYHLTQVLQVGTMAVLWGALVASGMDKMAHLVIALQGSLATTLVALLVHQNNVWQPVSHPHPEGITVNRLMLTKGAEGQTGSLLQLLTNRLNISQLERFISLDASGIYSLGYYAMEAVWTVGRAWAPAVHAEAARLDDATARRSHTLWHAWRVMALSALGALLGVFLPDALWHAIFEIHGLRPVLQSLAPAMVAGGVSSILAHHLSGVGLHRWNAVTSGLGLLVLWGCSMAWIPGAEEGAVMAGWAMSCAACAQCTGLSLVFWRCKD